jgi:hypothetical protein
MQELYLEELANLSGYRLKVFDLEDANDIIAWEFQSLATTFLEKVGTAVNTKYGEAVQVFFRFVKKDSSILEEEDVHALDAWVVPLHNKHECQFAIFLSVAMLRGIISLFTAVAVGPQEVMGGISEQTITEKFESDIYPYTAASLVFILLHEWVHIVQAHIPFLYSKKYMNSRKQALLSLHLIKPVPVSNLRSSRNQLRIHRSMEIDADLMALGIIMHFLEEKMPLLYDNVNINQPYVFGKSIAIVTRLLEQWRRTVSKEAYDPTTAYHPHPDVRRIFFIS